MTDVLCTKSTTQPAQYRKGTPDKDPPDDVYYTSLTLPNLRTFIVRIAGDEKAWSLGTRWLLNPLTTPALRELVLKYFRTLSVPEVHIAELNLGPGLVNLHRRSQFILERFQLSGTGTLVDDLIPFFNVVPSVKDLTLYGWECNALLGSLTATRTLFPNLTELAFWRYEGRIPWRLLCLLIESRWYVDEAEHGDEDKNEPKQESHVRLKAVSLPHGACSLFDDMEKKLDGWKAEGLEVYLIDEWGPLESDESQD